MSLLEHSINGAIEAIDLLRSCDEQYEDALSALAGAVERGNKILACGNGGSAADASHFMTELLCRFRDDRRPLPGIALATDGSFLTATGNDYGFDHVFSRQVEGLGREGDVLVGISTSGNSANVRIAIEVAKARKINTIALLGRDGGNIRGLADIEILVAHQDTARIQEAQKVLIHALCEGMEKRLNLV
jgi:D-sedoheptulose 7-phosphate isomerase